MELNVTQQEKVCIISLHGSLDALTVNEASEFFSLQISNGQYFLVADLSGLDFMSSAGLRLLLNATKEARSHDGDLRLAGASASLEKMLKLSGFTNIMKVFSKLEQAVGSYAS